MPIKVDGVTSPSKVDGVTSPSKINAVIAGSAGTGAATLAPLTSAGAGNLGVAGTAVATLTPVISTGSGNRGVAGTAGATLAPVISTGAGNGGIDEFTFGYITKGTEAGDPDGQVLYSKASNAPTGTIGMLNGYVRNTSGSSKNCKFAIYSHDAANNLPEAKLAETGVISVANGYNGLKSAEITELVLTPGATYWLSMIGEAGAEVFYDDSGGEKFEVFAATYPTFPDPCPNTGSLYSGTDHLSVYASNVQLYPPTFIIQIVNPISDTYQILPDTILSRDIQLNMAACKDEYHSASFAVQSLDVLTGLTVTPSILVKGGDSIPTSAYDIRTVKCWYQCNVNEFDAWDVLDGASPHRYLTPELLLYDDALIRVDTSEKNNYMAMSPEILISGPYPQDDPELIQPTDAATLQPVDFPANTTKQFWITFHVPADAIVGTYTGTIEVSDGINSVYIDVELVVHSFTLEQSNLIYGIYYRGELSEDPVIDVLWKSTTQMTAELQSMFDHGIMYPTVNGYPDSGRLALQTNIGFPTDLLFWMQPINLGGSMPLTAPQLAAKQAEVEDYISYVQSAGFDNIVVFGIDEAQDSVLANEESAFVAIHAGGGKTGVAVDYIDYGNNPYVNIPAIRNDLDYLLYSACSRVNWTGPDPDQAANWHSVGAKILGYADPHPFIADSRIYRAFYGWLVFSNNYDGYFDFAFQAIYSQDEAYPGIIWNPFIEIGANRNQIMAYPTTNGIIETTQYEGLREAINDMRYLATLQKAIADHPGSIATAATNWINSIKTSYQGLTLGPSPYTGITTVIAANNLDTLRTTMISYINQLLA